MPDWIAACTTDDVEPEDVIGFAHDDTDYAVYRSPDDEYFATAGHCTHAAELLCDGLVTGTIIECPKHNGRFDYRTGAAKGAPVLVDLRTYPTKVEAGVVYVDVNPDVR
jgi:3-phenylpropionate/trans-cinnamate dioxygenase ferredoxin component